MKRNLIHVALVFFLFIPSCIDPVDFSKGSNKRSLVVDGTITTEPGPYVVYLARTSDYNSYYSDIEEVHGAIVIISDDMGNSEMLTESYLPGIYKTDPGGLRGISGRSYKIEIETPDGNQYESMPELLGSVTEIDTVYYEQQQYQELDENNHVQSYEGFQIYFDTSDPEDDKNYYMWTWMGTHEVHTQPWSYTDLELRAAAPKDCCATCWIIEHSGQIDVLDDASLGENQIYKRPVTFVKILNSDGSRHYRGKYHIEVKQLSLSKEAYKYWSLIKEQINSSGSIFEPPPVAIIGNISNAKDSEDPVYGYFGASAISSKSIFIPANEAPYSPSDTLIWPDDCRIMSNSTAIKPSFW